MISFVQSWIEKNIPFVVLLVLFVLSLIFEVTRIPLNPYKHIQSKLKQFVQMVGDLMFSNQREKETELKNELREIRIQLNNLNEKINEGDRQTLVRSILRFADECRIGVRHSKEMFDTVLKDIDKYESLYHENNKFDSIIENAILYIKDVNRDCLKTNSYL